MIQAEFPLGHHLFQVPVAERIAQIPTKAENDNLILKVSPETVPAACSSLVHPTRLYSTRLRQIRRKCFAAVRSRLGDSMKAIVCPSESPARYKDAHLPATRTYVSSTRQERFGLR